MKTTKIGVLFLLFALGAVDAYAGRRLVLPSMRLRADAAGSNTSPSVQFPTGPTNNPIKVFEVRYRFEFSNISEGEQNVKLYARPGTRIGARTSRYLYSPYENGPFNPVVVQLSAQSLIASFRLAGYKPSNETQTLTASASAYLTLSCDIGSIGTNTTNCTLSAAYVYDNNNSPVGLPAPILTLTIPTSEKSTLERDLMLELVGNFDVVIDEDKGAITASVGSIANRVGGYAQSLQQSSGNIALNGGRPF